MKQQSREATGPWLPILPSMELILSALEGDGITVSTPTGSTAYNKSLGGAVLHPTIEALQIAEIASLNNRVYRTLGSSVIVPKRIRSRLHRRVLASTLSLSIIQPILTAILQR